MQDLTDKKHRQLLAKNRHLRYMWIPYTDSVVVVTNNPVKEVGLSSRLTAKQSWELSCRHRQRAQQIAVPSAEFDC